MLNALKVKGFVEMFNFFQRAFRYAMISFMFTVTFFPKFQSAKNGRLLTPWVLWEPVIKLCPCDISKCSNFT